MHHKPPQSIFDLFKDEYTASTEGRHTFVAWLDTISICPGDTIVVPKVGSSSIWLSERYGGKQVN